MFFLSCFSILKQHPADVQAQFVLPKSENPQSSGVPFEPKQQKFSLGISKARNKSSHLTPPSKDKPSDPAGLSSKTFPSHLCSRLPRSFCADNMRHPGSGKSNRAHSAQHRDTRRWVGRKRNKGWEKKAAGPETLNCFNLKWRGFYKQQLWTCSKP